MITKAYETGEIIIKRGRSMSVSINDFRDDPFYVDEDAQALLDECVDESSDQRLDMARIALDVMPDVSCKSVADALGLTLYQVVSVSNGRHNKAKKKGVSKGMELSEYTRDEILAAVDAHTKKGWEF
jgi:hypothetical protein